MRTTVLLLGLMQAFSVTTLLAEISREQVKAIQEARTVAHRNAFATAKGLARATNVEAADNALAAILDPKLSISAREHQMGCNLLLLAEQLRGDGRVALLRPTAVLALSHALLADRTATKPREKASANALAGRIQENYLGDRAAALQSYKTASQFSPEISLYKEAVTRLTPVEVKR